MRIGEIAKQSGVGPDTVRFYERHGLIHSMPSEDKTNNYRNYPEEALERIAMIRQAQQAGFSIAEFSQLIEQIENPVANVFDADQFLQQKIDEVEARLKEAAGFLDMLKATKAALSIAASEA